MPTVAQPRELLEREHELERVRAALHAVGKRAGRVVAIEGAAGIGKSRLLETARVLAPDLGVYVLNARGTELERAFPFGVVRQLFERRLLEADGAARDRWLAGAAALAADLLTGSPTTPSNALGQVPSVSDPGYAWLHGLYWLASNLSSDSPLVLVVDDLQWCDAPSVRALAFIARRLDGQPLGLILATRPLDSALSPETTTLVADPAVELLRPLPLTRTAIGALVASRLSGEPHESFVRVCDEVTGGNPFLIGELLEEAAARGLEPTAAAATDVSAIVPRGVANAVLLRLARLVPAATPLARAGPPARAARTAALRELGQPPARAGAPQAIAPLSEIVEHGEDPAAIAAAALELSGMLFFAGRTAEGAVILRRAHARLPAGEPAREQLEVALLGLSSTSASARREAHATLAALRDPGGPARTVLEATTLATLALDELLYLRSASTTIDLAERAIAAGLPLEPHRGENWAILALVALAGADGLDTALRCADEMLVRARTRGSAVTVVAMLSLRARGHLRLGDLAAAEADAQAAIELAHDLLGGEDLVMAVASAVLAGLERDKTPDSLRRLVDRAGVRLDEEFVPSYLLRYASGVLHAAAGNREAAVEELKGCARGHPVFGGENPAMLPWRSAAALSLAELGQHDEARRLAADEVSRARSFGAAPAIGIALRAQALVGPRTERPRRLAEALAVLEPSPARLEHARVLVDLGATFRAAGQRTAARDPLLEGLALAARCGARALERRARAELAAVGVRPRTAEHAGADSLTPSERRVVELAADGGTNREIAQTLFVTEKTVETHLGRAFRKLDISSRRQLPDVLTHAAE